MTTKQKTGVCPRKSLGGFNYTDIGVVFRTDKGSQEVMVGAAWLTAPVFDPETQQQSYLLSGRSAMGHTFSVRVPADKLRNPSALADIIGHYGVHVYKPALANQLMFEWVKLLSVSNPNVQQLTLISELGWQIHNLGCEYQNDEKLLDRLQDLRGMAWEIADIAREPRA